MKKKQNKFAERKKKITKLEAEVGVRDLLNYIGENTEREGLVYTPMKVVRFLKEFLTGYEVNPIDILKESIKLEEQYDQMILLKGIQYSSFCEHHLLPFYGKVHIAYFPDKKIAGIGRLEKLVKALSSKLQIQERLTKEIIQTIGETLKPKGIAVIIDGFHLCLHLKEKGKAKLITCEYRGSFKEQVNLRIELQNLLKITS
jgi:GTP cyclohydrolase I